MKRTMALLALLFTFGLGSALAADASTPVPATPAPKAAKPAKKAASPKAVKEVWVCPMGDYKGPRTADGKCPNCKMDLVKVKEKTGGKKAGTRDKGPKPSTAAPEAKKTVWTCPMCGGSYGKAGKCPDCGMDLVLKK